jgi:hypothetical protein
MNDTLNADILWSALAPADVELGARTLLAGKYPGGREASAQAMAAMAKARRFRVSFLQRRKPEQNIPLLLPLLRQGSDLVLRFDVLKAWLISGNLSMFGEFLDAAGVPHEGGFVEDDAPTPTKEQLKKAITKIAAKYPPRVVAVYLGLQIFVGGDFVKNLGPALEELEWPLTEHLRDEVMAAG